MSTVVVVELVHCRGAHWAGRSSGLDLLHLELLQREGLGRHLRVRESQFGSECKELGSWDRAWLRGSMLRESDSAQASEI